MDNIAFVGGFQRLRNLSGDFQRIVKGQPSSFQAVLQRFTFNELHHDAAHVTGFADAVNVRDVRVIQSRENLSFALKSGKPVSVGGEDFRQNFERYVPAELRVARTIHFTHTARADGRDDLVMIQTHSRYERHRAPPARYMSLNESAADYTREALLVPKSCSVLEVLSHCEIGRAHV